MANSRLNQLISKQITSLDGRLKQAKVNRKALTQLASEHDQVTQAVIAQADAQIKAIGDLLKSFKKAAKPVAIS